MPGYTVPQNSIQDTFCERHAVAFLYVSYRMWIRKIWREYREYNRGGKS